jgi:tRNA(His) guanylyltransferase
VETDLGDRMKLLEQVEAGRRFMPLLPVNCRMDGKGFHKWTSDLERPYDERLTKLMVETSRRLAEETDAKIAYCQSDEISLILYSDNYNSQIFFDGKIQKIVSVLASLTTGIFNSLVPQFFSEKRPVAFFDARAWNTPNKTESVNNLIFREQDASRNSVSMAAQKYFSHKMLQGKTCFEMQEMLFHEKGINWNDYPAYFRRGTYIQRRKVTRTFTEEELLKIPEKYRPGKDETRERTDVMILDLPPLAKIVNREEVVFDGAEALVEE